MSKIQCYVHASEILTGAGIAKKGGRRVSEEDLGRIEDGAIVFEVSQRGKTTIPKKIKWVGKTADLPKRFSRIKKRNLRGANCIVPGLIDCHTHLVFAGDRSDEFALRCGGVSYEEIAAKGGGILSTIRPTREATLSELERLAVARVKEAESFGVRTLEIKSGYGLSVEAEIKSLEVVKRLRKRFPHLTFKATFLGAHAFPPDYSREEYLRLVIEEMLPLVVKKKLADACDVFIDRGYYTIEEAQAILERARELGLATKIHGDELVNTESAAFGAENGALSVDHLLNVSEKGIQALAKSETVAVLLPGTAFYLKAAHAPARALIDSGACVAISTDFNPGSSMCNSLPAILTISALYLEMTRAELFASVTYNAAKALGLEKKKGTLEAGKDADLAVLPFKRFEQSYYQFAPRWKASH